MKNKTQIAQATFSSSTIKPNEVARLLTNVDLSKQSSVVEIEDAISSINMDDPSGCGQLAMKLMKAGLVDQAELLLARMSKPVIAPLNEELTALGYSVSHHTALINLARARKDTALALGLTVLLAPHQSRLAEFSSISMEERIELASANREMVPRAIHQIWIGTREPPVTTQIWREYCEANRYEYKLWREPDLKAIGVFNNQNFIRLLEKRSYPSAVDIARYIMLHEVGGIYLDCDWIPVQDHVPFHDAIALLGFCALAAAVPREIGIGACFVTNSFLAAPAKHPTFRKIIEVLPRAFEAFPNAPAWWVPGPALLSTVARGSVTVIDQTTVARGFRGKTLEEAKVSARPDTGIRTSALIRAWKPW